MKKLIAMLYLFCAFGLSAQSFEYEDLIIKGDIRLWGADAALGYKGRRFFPGVDTILWVSAGGGYQSANFFPDNHDSTPPDDPDEASYKNLNCDWRLGVSQGILYNHAQGKNLLDFTLLYRGKYQHYLENDSIPPEYPDREGILQNSIVCGLVLDSVLVDKAFMTKEGIYSSLSAEFAPKKFFNNLLGNTRFARLTALGIAYKELLSSESISIYLGDRLIFDYLFGRDEEIPISARTTCGGLTRVPIHSNPGTYRALGYAVRGIQNDRFDGFIKMVNNIDIRVHFPALTVFNLVTPGLVVYFDGGIYDQLSRKLKLSPIYLSTGAGLIFHALGTDFILCGNYFINENRFTVSLELGAHF